MSKEQLSTLDKEVPKHKNALEEKYKEEKVESVEEKRIDETNVANIQDELPIPSGWRLLVLPFTPKEKTKGGIIIAQEALDKARIATNCGYVVKIGPMAYGDKEKFPTGPWCKKGDWVIFARYAGSRLPIEGGEVRLLNDDEVLGTIKDPESVLHYI
jgi:co-chaperonin GroES (HSP10)